MKKSVIILALLLALFAAPAAQAAELSVKGEVGFDYYYTTGGFGPLFWHSHDAHFMLDFSGIYSREISYLLQITNTGRDRYAIVYRPASMSMEFTLGQNYYQRDKFDILDNDVVNNFSETGVVITPTGFGDNFTASVYLDTKNASTDLSNILSRITADYKAGFGDLSLGVYLDRAGYTAYSVQAAVPLKTSTPVTALVGISGTDQTNADPVYNFGIKTTYSGTRFSLEYSSLNSQIGIGAGKTLSTGLESSVQYLSRQDPASGSREGELLAGVTLKF